MLTIERTPPLHAVDTSTPLADVLQRLDIVPFNPAAVHAYKKQKMEEICRNKIKTAPFTEILQFGPYEYAEMRRVEQFAGLCGRYWPDDHNILFRCFRSQSYGPPLAIVLIWDRMVRDLTSPSLLYGSLYAPIIPEHVQRKAEQIVNEAPGTIVETETLRDFAEFYDPFLVVRRTGSHEHYHIEVWEETGFEEAL